MREKWPHNGYHSSSSLYAKVVDSWNIVQDKFAHQQCINARYTAQTSSTDFSKVELIVL